MSRTSQSGRPSAEPTSSTSPVWVKTAEAAKLVGLSPSCLKNYRLKNGWLIEGIHWVYTSSSRRMILYNVELLCDWVANRSSPEVHIRKIEAYLLSQASKGGRRASKYP